jgi:regulator of protease activity HflC (stomatin/prohibitin superfamily)
MKTDIVAVMGVVAAMVTALIALLLPRISSVFRVPEGWAGLLYHHGEYVRRAKAGRNFIWGFGWTMNFVDLRKASLTVAGQDVLTADNVGLKLSVVIRYQVTDPIKVLHDTQSWHNDLYNAAQIALRAVVGGLAAEALLNQRLEIGAQLLARVQPEGAKVGIDVLAVEVKDVMFPADLKRAFGDVLKAKQEGQAALERARGESAALRNLANAARVLEGNPALMNLRLMQSLSAAQNAGNTLVIGMPGGFVPLKTGTSAAGETKQGGDAEP